MSSERWSVDGVPLGSAAWCFQQIPDGAVPLRGEDAQVARRDGLAWRRKYYGGRLIPIVMGVRSEDEHGRRSAAVYRANVDRLKRAWHKPHPVEIRRVADLPDNRLMSRTIRGEVRAGFDVETPSGLSVGTFTVEVFCADPFWYDEPQMLTGRSGTFDLFNPGTVQHRNAVIRLHGPAADPTVTVEPSGSSFTLAGTIPPGGWVEVDSDRFTAVDNLDVSRAGWLTRTGPALVELAPGHNLLTLSDGTCDVSWQAVYL